MCAYEYENDACSIVCEFTQYFDGSDVGALLCVIWRGTVIDFGIVHVVFVPCSGLSITELWEIFDGLAGQQSCNEFFFRTHRWMRGK